MSKDNETDMDNFGSGELAYSVGIPGKRWGSQGKSRTIDEWLDAFWNNLVSSDPDDTTGDIVFLRTSPSRKAGPFRKHIELSEYQSLIVPWRTCEYDIDDGITQNVDIEKWKEAAAGDMADGDQPSEGIFTIDGKPIVKDLKNYYSAPHECTISPHASSKVKKELEVPFSDNDSNRPAVVAGYIIMLRLKAREKPYVIIIEAKGKDGYETKANYEISVK